MVTCKLWFALLLLYCADSKGVQEHIVKTIGKEPDITPVCSNITGNFIISIVCTIRTDMSRGRECRLLYRYEEGFIHECDSRFTLMKKNQTVFLHLINLTPKESGNYTCQCTYNGGTHTLHLNITVEEDEDEDEDMARATEIPLSHIGIGLTVFVFVTCVILGFVYTKRCHGRRQALPMTSPPNTILPTEAEDIEPYSVFMQKENGLYSTTRIHSLKTRTNTNVFNT